jgi:septum formation protein
MSFLKEQLKGFKIILGSGSPRRKELLGELGVDFTVDNLSVDEIYPEGLKGADIALFLADLKAISYPSDRLTDKTILITADTIVCLNDEVMGKPDDQAHAVEILRSLSGETHRVITAVCLRNSSRKRLFFNETKVTFKSLSDDEIHYYIERYKPFDKAGAYGIQEWIGFIGIEKIDGSYFNVMGLPVHQLYDELQQFVSLVN